MGERVVILSTDVDDFVYAELWVRAIAEECAGRGHDVDVITAERVDGNLAYELGGSAPPPRRDRITRHRAPSTSAAVAALDARPAAAVFANVRPLELVELHRRRPTRDGAWVIWDRHIETDLDREPAHHGPVAEVVRARRPAVFSFRTHLPAGSRFVQHCGLPVGSVHLHAWSNPRWLWSSASLPLGDGRVRVFAGGNSARDYGTFAEAMAGVDALACCVTELEVPLEGATCVPRLPLHRFRDAIATCDIVAIPLRHETLAGIGVLVLAMGLGKPIVMTDMPFARKLATHEEEILFVPRADADAMRTALTRLTLDPSLRERLGAAAGARARRELDLADLARRMVDTAGL